MFFLPNLKSAVVKGLILAGGHGTRLRPLTFTGNKHMIPIANKPMIFYGLDHLSKAGIEEIGVILGPIGEGVKETIGDGSIFGVKITYISQPDPKGLAHAVLAAEDFLKEEPFVMYLGDNLLKQGVRPLINSYFNNNSDCVICVTPVDDPERYGIVELDFKGNVVRLIEKPQELKSNLALAGAYLFNDSIFEAAKKIKPSWRNELEITDAIQSLLESGKKISVQHIDGWWKDTGKPEDLLEANQLVLDDIRSRIEGTIDPSCQIIGKVSVGKDTVVKHNSRIKGPVIIGEKCEIGPNVYVGPYTSIGDNVKILSGEVEGSIIMQNVLMNCNKRIIDSIIGQKSRLESGDAIYPSGLRFVVGESTLCRV
jgi:glucose-1-phosphate thymidylyltransferase